MAAVWLVAAAPSSLDAQGEANAHGTIATHASGQTSLATNAPAGVALSTRVVAYVIDAHIDMTRKTVDATESLTYHNLTGQPLSTFPFHLYLNAFQPQSTFTSETHFNGGIRDSESADGYPAKKLGSITIQQLTAEGYGDLTGALHFISPDDGNANDKTVAELKLSHPVAPGASVTFQIRFHDQFPESVARNGYKRDFLMGGQWYPKLGVFWRNAEYPQGAWNCHQYHATTEFFSDFGTFNVRLTLPRNETVGASGVPTGVQLNPDGTRTLSFYGEDIGDFAWAASPNFNVVTGTYLGSMGPVQVRVLVLKEHAFAGQRYLKILLGSLAQFDARYGPYPYKLLTLIDPEPNSEIGGMEYPTLITGDALRFDPTNSLEVTAEHEFGHQYWYGMVATNEFEDAWLDEGINSYTETKVTAALLGRDTSMLNKPWANLSDAGLQYIEYEGDPNFDPVTRDAWKFRNSLSYASITYGKSATLLRTLDGIIGEDTMDEAMRTYFLRYRFQHPTTQDFLNTIEEVAVRRGRATATYAKSSAAPALDVMKLGIGRENPFQLSNTAAPVFTQGSQTRVMTDSSLRPFFRAAVYGTAELDYAIDSIRSGPAEWWKDHPDPRLIRSTVTVHRIGDFILPVTVEVTFDDGTHIREQWAPDLTDPAASRAANQRANTRWHTWTYVGPHSKVVSAEVDPDHLLQMDLNRFNNSRTVVSNDLPARKITNLWLTATQFAAQIAGWLV